MSDNFLTMLGSDVAFPNNNEGRRWSAIDGNPLYRTIEHIQSESPPEPGVLSPDQEIWIGKIRFAADDQLTPPEESGGLLVFAQEPQAGDEEEFDDWMDTEHVPALASVDGVLMAYRYEAMQGTPKFAALYYLVEPGVCTSDRWRSASRTPWRDRMTKRNQNRQRGLYVPAE